MSEYEQMEIREAYFELRRALDNRIKLQEPITLLVDVEGKVECRWPGHIYDITEKPYYLTVAIYDETGIRYQSKVANALKKAARTGKRVRIKGKIRNTFLYPHEITVAKQNGELSVYEGSLEGALTVSEEERQLSIVEEEK